MRALLFILVLTLFLLYGCEPVGKASDIFKETDCNKGDINIDGFIDDDDLTILESYLKGNIKLNDNEIYCADMNSDDIIDLEDKEALLVII